MATYEIKANSQYDSNEVYFGSKPAPEVLGALKALKMRWNPKKGCWYGFASQDEILNAIAGSDKDFGGVLSDGYMGATRWDGNKSHLHLYGADLSKAIREDLKKAGLKGCSVRCHSYSGGQSLTITVDPQEDDFVSFEDFLPKYNVWRCGYWLWADEDHQKHISEFSDGIPSDIIELNARKDYEYQKGHAPSHHHFNSDENNALSAGFRRKLNLIAQIVESYNYDDSNSMVDYFDTNFYWDFDFKKKKVA